MKTQASALPPGVSWPDHISQEQSDRFLLAIRTKGYVVWTCEWTVAEDAIEKVAEDAIETFALHGVTVDRSALARAAGQ